MIGGQYNTIDNNWISSVYRKKSGYSPSTNTSYLTLNPVIPGTKKMRKSRDWKVILIRSSCIRRVSLDTGDHPLAYSIINPNPVPRSNPIFMESVFSITRIGERNAWLTATEIRLVR